MTAKRLTRYKNQQDRVANSHSLHCTGHQLIFWHFLFSYSLTWWTFSFQSQSKKPVYCCCAHFKNSGELGTDNKVAIFWKKELVKMLLTSGKDIFRNRQNTQFWLYQHMGANSGLITNSINFCKMLRKYLSRHTKYIVTLQCPRSKRSKFRTVEIVVRSQNL